MKLMTSLQAKKSSTQELQSLRDEHRAALDEATTREKDVDGKVRKLNREVEVAHQVKDEMTSRAKKVY